MMKTFSRLKQTYIKISPECYYHTAVKKTQQKAPPHCTNCCIL